MRNNATLSDKEQSGNILFLILLAVVLFAALAYAVTSSMRGGGKDASSEKARAQASALIQYGVLIQSTVQRSMLVNGIPEYLFDASADSGVSISSATANTNCTQTACRLFTRSSREGLTGAQKFGEEYVDPRYRANSPSYGGGAGTEMRFWVIRVEDLGTSKPEVMMRIPGIKPEICQAVNDILWGQAINPNEFYGTPDAYSGNLTSLADTSSWSIGDDSAFFKGKHAGCYGREGVSTGPYGGEFYQVLIER